MIDVKDSLDKLQWTAEHHYLHIIAKHDFMRAWAVQFELAYTDFRAIQMALQLSGKQHPTLAKFTDAYDRLYGFEYEFAANGLDAFYSKFTTQKDLDNYEKAKNDLLAQILIIQKLGADD
ncbi:hypothetical protein ACVPPR_08810 [Dellaglioa sp. L3N]